MDGASAGGGGGDHAASVAADGGTEKLRLKLDVFVFSC
jgi:hypothetical protein